MFRMEPEEVKKDLITDVVVVDDDDVIKLTPYSK